MIGQGVRTIAVDSARACFQAATRSGIRAALTLLGLLTISPLQALPLVPQPVRAQADAGRVLIDASSVVSAVEGDAASTRVARYLSELLQRSHGPALAVRSSDRSAAIRLRLDPSGAPAQAESYRLHVGDDGVDLSARSESGLFYGAITLWQLLSADRQSAAPITLQGVLIEDWPRFRWRGVMLDSARHFQDVDTIKRLLDGMALHKLNTLHWHLTDDQGWRLQIARYPALTDIGAWRVPPAAGQYGQPLRYGGFYTQQQIRELVAYAAARHITVVPELDMPGHAQAAAAAYPRHVGASGQAPQVATSWGIHDYLYGVDEDNLAFVRNVLDEVIALFPGRDVHIGGDEALKYQWQASPSVQARMRALGVASEDALQSWFVGQVGAHLAARGRRLIGWDEILDGPLPAHTAIMSWRGIDGAVVAAKRGHDTILTPSPTLYFDNLQSDRGDEPAGRLKIQTLADVYRFEPVPGALDARQATHVLGAQAQLWTEYLVEPWQIDHAMYPRIAALAERVWSPADVRDWDGFLQRLVPQLRRYQRLGIDYADSAFAVAARPLATDASNATAATVGLYDQAGFGQLRYTVDGSVPTPDSALYREPLTLAPGVQLRAAAFAADGTPLSKPRAIGFDRDAATRLDSSRLRACRDDGLRLRLPLLPDLGQRDTPAYNVDLFDACWIYPGATLSHGAQLRVEAARLPRNFGLTRPQLARRIVRTPPPEGNQLQVRAGRCDGPLLATLPLPSGDTLGERFTLTTTLPPQHAAADLCLTVAAPLDGPLYALDSVQVTSPAPAPADSTTAR